MSVSPIVSVDLIIQNNKGQILLGKVSKKWQDGGKYLWGLPGREISFGENLKASAARNLTDETQMDMVSGQVVCVNSNFGYGNHYVSIGILIEAVGIPKVMQPEDWEEWKWFDKTDIPTKLFPSAEQTLKVFLKGVFSLDFA